MWINNSHRGNDSTLTLACDECGAVFMPAGDRRGRGDKHTYWHWANIAGWARVARTPDRHICASC